MQWLIYIDINTAINNTPGPMNIWFIDMLAWLQLLVTNLALVSLKQFELTKLHKALSYE